VLTYQSVSGGGKGPMDELIEQTKQYLEGKNIESKKFYQTNSFQYNSTY